MFPLLEATMHITSSPFLDIGMRWLNTLVFKEGVHSREKAVFAYSALVTWIVPTFPFIGAPNQKKDYPCLYHLLQEAIELFNNLMSEIKVKQLDSAP